MAIRLTTRVGALALAAGLVFACERGPQAAPGAADAAGDPVAAALASAPPCEKRTFLGDALAAQTTWTFDAAGRPLTEAEDRDGDGAVDRVLTHRYDALGQRVETLTDEGADGSTDQLTRRTFDPLGRLVVEALDRDADGAVDAIRTYGYGGDDRLRWTAWDADADGDVDERRELTYDEAGRLLMEQTFARDAAAADCTKTYDYDYHGWLVEVVEERRSSDHASTLATRFEYDAAGVLTAELVDFGADGDVDQAIAYTWDAAAGLLAAEAIDKGDDGDVDERITYSYTCWE